jgi:hypothetical protein
MERERARAINFAVKLRGEKRKGEKESEVGMMGEVVYLRFLALSYKNQRFSFLHTFSLLSLKFLPRRCWKSLYTKVTKSINRFSISR